MGLARNMLKHRPKWSQHLHEMTALVLYNEFAKTVTQNVSLVSDEGRQGCAILEVLRSVRAWNLRYRDPQISRKTRPLRDPGTPAT